MFCERWEIGFVKGMPLSLPLVLEESMEVDRGNDEAMAGKMK